MELHSKKPSDGISNFGLYERGLLFAELSSIAYMENKEASKYAKKLGFTTVEFYDKAGAQAYRFMNKNDLVIICRGTEPTEWNDIKADLQAMPVMAETVSRVHRGFKGEVDELWPMIYEDVKREAEGRKLWFCGHSLGAAMTTIMSSRCFHDTELVDPVEVHTYGSPRVGWPKYVGSLGMTHHRWVNNNDIVTRVPLWIMGYRHHGTEHYIDSEGDIDQEKGLVRFWDGLQGFFSGLAKGSIDQIGDHNMSEYIAHIGKALNGKIEPK